MQTPNRWKAETVSLALAPDDDELDDAPPLEFEVWVCRCAGRGCGCVLWVRAGVWRGSACIARPACCLGASQHVYSLLASSRRHVVACACAPRRAPHARASGLGA